MLKSDVAEQRSWTQPQQKQDAHLYVDARSTPPRCAAVLFLDGHTYFTDGEPGKEHMKCVGKRGDGQILSLELMAIAVGLATFADELQGRQVWIFEDNTAAEAMSSNTQLCSMCVLVRAGSHTERQLQSR